ncbi:cysteine desulfurase family protein [Aquisalinus flavus]|uniref:Cysteine desulfurase n=1 Tax=Aquisalinus flavus TaxID=1526572 RepID=A0A8J2V4F6_9PROT|nr:cysteine desulfurase family protein [Aquisalinus flavus]MBD0427542.1 cysteine desulfurase [Aquisalinus flavus]GGD01779.1 cysteine desulfurase [Aquisalinus flavus]
MSRLFLDHNATTPIKPAVKDAMIAAMEAGNPSSVHAEGRKAKALIEAARADVAAACDAPKEGIIFTSGGTEAINMALYGIARREKQPVTRLIVSGIEHNATLRCARALEQQGLDLEIIPTLENGRADTDWLKSRLADYAPEKEGIFMVCLMLANNETGVIQDVSGITSAIFAKGGYLFVDAVQAFGKMPISFSNLQADLMAVSAHKINGPKGAGALLSKPAVPLAPLVQGGGQEMSRRAGTEGIITIAGFSAAAREIDLDSAKRLEAIRDRIEAGLKQMDIPGLKIFGEDAPRVPNTTCFAAPGFRAETQIMALDLAGIAISAGSACSSGKVTASHVTTAMGASSEEAECSIRVSLGFDTPDDAAEIFLKEWSAAYARATKRASQSATTAA